MSVLYVATKLLACSFPFLQDSQGFTPLMRLLQSGCVPEAKQLLTQGDCNLAAQSSISAATSTTSSSSSTSSAGRSSGVNTTTGSSSSAGRSSGVTTTSSSSCAGTGSSSSSACGSSGVTALHLACSSKEPDLQLIEALLRAGAPVEAQAGTGVAAAAGSSGAGGGDTALVMALRAQHVELVKLLLKYCKQVGCGVVAGGACGTQKQVQQLMGSI